MKLTTLFRLRKPDGTDPVNIEDFNDNFDVIDEELGKRLESTGAASDMTVAFEQASARTNLKTGEKISVSFGKIMKWFADLGTAAFQSVANNLTTTVAGSLLDARQGKILNDKYNQLNSEIKAVNVYVGSDGKLHFTNSGGADSVLPFSSINAVEDISSKLTAYASQNHGFRSTESLAGYKYVIVCATYQGGKSANFTTFSGCSCMIQTGWDAGGWTNEGIGVHSNHLCILSNITGVIDVYASSTGTGYTSVRAFALS